MPVSAAIGAVALGGAGLQGLWQYNRDNYFFDVPLKQNRQFQLQNIGMARFALFREDLRDLSALTTEKVQNYFVVNTLKLGFIVTIFFNFDRIDTEAEAMNFVEQQINLLFSVTLMTAFFFLLTSIWFSMHAVMLAESITTKMLVQACRIPLPSMGEVKRAATDGRHFETDFNEAFRVPFIGDTLRKRLADKWNERWNRRRGATDPGPAGGVGSGSGGGGGGGGGERPPGEDVHQVPSSYPDETEDAFRCGATVGHRKGLVNLSILDIIDGCVDPELLTDVESSLEPHLKFYRLIRPTWTGFDLYGKIAMEIGTATLLSGLAFYAIFYLRVAGASFSVCSGGWIAFTFLSVLAWYSLILDLQISFVRHVMLACPMIACYIGTVVYISFLASDPSPLARWVLTLVVFLQAMWVQVICWSGAGLGNDYPKIWRATRYLNVLHEEKGPAPFQRDHLNVHKERIMPPRHANSNTANFASPSNNGSFPPTNSWGTTATSPQIQPHRTGVRVGSARSATSPGFLRASSCAEESSEEDESEAGSDTLASAESNQADSDAMAMDTLQAFAAAFPLLHCLGLMLETLSLGKQRKTVYQARDHLYEAARAAGALPVGTGATDTVGLIKPFWILLPPQSKRACQEAHRVDMSLTTLDLQAMQAERAPEITLSELLDAVRKVSDILFADSMTWTVRDMERFVRYGGEPIPGVASFLGQFHEKGSSQTHFPGTVASALFRIGVLITAILWVVACIWSINFSITELRNRPVDTTGYHKVTGKREADIMEAFGRQVELILPRPWLLPSSMGCDRDGQRLVLGDVDGAFVGSANGSNWIGPLRPCWGAELLSADFGPKGGMWLSTTVGVHSTPLDASASRLCRPQPVDVPKLEKLALDSAPLPGAMMQGIAISNGRLHALEADPIEGWRVAGTIGSPIKKPVIALALRAGRALVLDSIGAVHRLHADTGKWDRPVVLTKDYHWKGLCLLPESDDWLALGRPKHAVGIRQLWRFAPPDPWLQGELGDASHSLSPAPP